MAKMAQETQTMVPSYEENKAKLGEINGTVNLGFKRPVHKGYTPSCAGTPLPGPLPVPFRRWYFRYFSSGGCRRVRLVLNGMQRSRAWCGTPSIFGVVNMVGTRNFTCYMGAL